MSWQNEPLPSSPERLPQPDNARIHIELPFFIDGTLTPARMDINTTEGMVSFNSGVDWFNILDTVSVCDIMQVATVVGLVEAKAALDFKTEMAEERASNKVNHVDVAGHYSHVSPLGPGGSEYDTKREAAKEALASLTRHVANNNQWFPQLRGEIEASPELIMQVIQDLAIDLLTGGEATPREITPLLQMVKPTVDLSFYTKLFLRTFKFVFDNHVKMMQWFVLLKILFGFCKSKYPGETIANILTLAGFVLTLHTFFPKAITNVSSVEEQFVGFIAFQKAQLASCIAGNTAWCQTQTDVLRYMAASQQKYVESVVEWATRWLGSASIVVDGIFAVWAPSLTTQSFNPVVRAIKFRNKCCDMVRIYAGLPSPHALPIEGVKLLYGNGLKWAQTTHGRELHELLKNERRNRWRINEIKRDIQDAQKVNFSTPAGKSNWNDFASNIKAHSQ